MVQEWVLIKLLKKQKELIKSKISSTNILQTYKRMLSYCLNCKKIQKV